MIGSRNKILLILSGLLMCMSTAGQTISDLRDQKQKTRQEIEYTNWLLNKTGKSSKASLNQLSLLNEQVSLRNKLITEYNEQISLLQNSIRENERVIQMLSNDLERIKEEYARLIRQANRQRGDYNKLIFIVSSNSFNQAYKRLLYVRQMARYRQVQSEQIDAIREVMLTKSDELSERRHELQDIVVQQMREFSMLKNEQDKQSRTYQQLQNRQRELTQHLRYQQRVEQRLENEIERLIEEEARRAREMARTPEFELLSEDFEKNRGRLPWPTRHGVITDKFGEHPHPVMRNIIIRNNGIDITTRPGEKARAVFNGTVSRVFAIPGGNTAVIVRHGEFITVYSNLKEVYVKQGEQVTLNQDLGLIYVDPDEDNKTVLKFQIWKENLKQNPEVWIAR